LVQLTLAVAHLGGWTWSDVNPFRATINFFPACNNLFCENSPNGLVAGESSSKEG